MAAVAPFVLAELFCESVVKIPPPPPPAVADDDAPVPVAVCVPPTIAPPGMRGIAGLI